MPIDRDATLKKAEKLLRQGKLDGAIAEYVRLLDDQPGDWSSVNALGDLYARAGQIDKAVAQFTRVADHLWTEGFLPKAAALYKKVLRANPVDTHAMLQLAETAARQGVLVDAKSYLRQASELRRKAGDARGAAELVVRIGELSADDPDAKVAAARAAQQLQDVQRASALLQEAAEAFESHHKPQEALTALGEAVALDPTNERVRGRLLSGLLAGGDVEGARRVARTSEELQAIARALDEQQRRTDSLDVLIEAAQLDPGNLELKTRLVRECAAAGRLDQARQFLNPQTVGDDPALLMMLARLELQSNRIDEGRQALNRFLSVNPERRDELVLVACELADEKLLDAAFACVDIVADAALIEEDWAAAAAALHEFVTRVPNQIPALMKLVEICVDGGLESTMYMAQGQLADAYLTAGLGKEARVIAEDLVAREPWARVNIDRFRRALLLLGVANPDAIIAERLSGESPFLSTDAAIDLPAPTPVQADVPEPAAMPEVSAAVPAPAAETAHAAAPASDLVLDSLEIDLSDALADLKGFGAPASAAEPSVEEMFDDLRGRAERESQMQSAQAQFEAGIEFAARGRIGEAINAFEMAVRVPSLRFEAASRLGRLHEARGDLASAVEWLERAAEAPAPTAEEGHALMFELADALERIGETARALAILLELDADADGYRDVSARIERLSRVQTGS